MANGEARPPLGATHAIPLLRDVWYFALRPSIAPATLRPGRDYAIALAILLFLILALTAASAGIEQVATSFGYEPLEAAELRFAPAIHGALAVLAAPLIEEPLFRGWLSGRRAALRLLFRCLVGLAIISGGAWVGYYIGDRSSALVIAAFGLAVIAASAVRWLRTHRSDTAVSPAFERWFPWVVWASSLSFGLMHLTNFIGPYTPLDSVLVISQTLGGLLLAYTRTRLGLLAAMLQHGMFNALLLLLEFG